MQGFVCLKGSMVVITILCLIDAPIAPSSKPNALHKQGFSAWGFRSHNSINFTYLISARGLQDWVKMNSQDSIFIWFLYKLKQRILMSYSKIKTALRDVCTCLPESHIEFLVWFWNPIPSTKASVISPCHWPKPNSVSSYMLFQTIFLQHYIHSQTCMPEQSIM